MNDLNITIAKGRLTGDPEVRTFGETTMVAFSIALNEQWKTKSGEQKEETTYLDCKLFGPSVDNFVKLVGKGSSVFIEGRLRQERWESKDGSKNSKIILRVNDWHLIK